MRKWLVIGIRIVGILFILHALMLVGADEISTLEAGGVRMIRSTTHILALYGADPTEWAESLSMPFAGWVMTVLAWPGWAVLGGIGALLALIARPRD